MTTQRVIEVPLSEWASQLEDEAGELVNGRIVEEEVPDYIHEFLVALLARLLGNWLLPQGGFVAGSDAKFAITERSGRKPDLSAFLPGSPPPPRRGIIRRPPDIAVEIVSPTPRDAFRDRVEKVADYARFGVRYYWLVDPELRSFEVLELGADRRYVHALGASAGKLDSIPGCPGLVVDLDEIWSQLDRLAPPEEPGAGAE